MIKHSISESIELGLSGSVSCLLGLNIVTSKGASQAHTVLEALRIHRDFLLEQASKSRIAGEYEEAFSYYREYEQIRDALDEITVNALNLAYHNYRLGALAGQTKANAKQKHQAELAHIKESKREDYELFLRSFVFGSNGEENEPATDQDTANSADV